MFWTHAQVPARCRLKRTRKNSLGTESHKLATFLQRSLIHELAHNSSLEREDSFAERQVVQLECGVVRLSFFDVSFQPRILLHEFMMRSSRLDDCAAERSSWLQEAGWHALRTTGHCENANLPIGKNLGMAERRQTRAVQPRSIHRTTESFLPIKFVQ